ncbi:MAG: NAD(P)H-dependent glycerol-3-phosphate dehydrogenase [Pseudomonadota bacterium]
MSDRIAILGRGAWGTALATTLTGAGAEVIPWDRRADDAVLGDADLVLAAVTAQATRSVLDRVAAALKPGAVLALTAKGLERETHLRQSQIAAEAAPAHPAAVLSGPGFAADLTMGLPTAVTLAVPRDMTDPEGLQARIATPGLRPYLSTDRIGTELGGALKNVIAIACGTALGAGLGESARAALMTRGFAEMVRIAVAAGADRATLGGLAGLGDLTLTCTSQQSRNYRYGLALGEAGQAPKTGTYEGAHTAAAALSLAQSLNVDAPIIEATAALVAGQISVQEAVSALYARPLRRE